MPREKTILLRVLAVEDDCDDKVLLQELFKQSTAHNYRVTYTTSLHEAVEMLNMALFDVILCDLNLTDSTGMDTCMKIHEKAHNTPVLILTGYDDVDWAKKALRCGVQDYVVKSDLNLRCLERAITFAIERNALMARQKKAREEIQSPKGMLPICAYCKKIRDEDGYWEQIETYIANRSGAFFTHSICPECAEREYGITDMAENK
ncbi:MAG: response regulator [Deltaproteobacteria bacterium]|nr:response regulator [Deltaproteobacteria bacterium]